MSGRRRVQQEPAFILHRRPFRDTSQILDVLTRDHGKIALVARGSRGAKSKLAGVLRPFLPLKLSWAAKTDLGTLTGAEAAARPISLVGDALLSAYYVNELMLVFLHRHDPQPELYALYERAIPALARSESLAATLRSFEIEFLSLLGYALNFESSDDDGALHPERRYAFRVDQGPVPVERSKGDAVFEGRLLLGIAAQQFDDDAVLSAANRLLRQVIAWHLGGRELKSRKVLKELHRGRIAPSSSRKPDSD